MKVRLSILACLLATSAFSAEAVDPPVPPGRDPGGMPVAIIGMGIDYTKPHLSQMLARDGEGEIIGWDFVDDDRRPFARDETAAKNVAASETVAAEIVTGEGQAATLAPFRVRCDDAVSLGNAIGYATKSPAKVIAILCPFATAAAVAVLPAASRRFPDHLFIVAAGDAAADLDQTTPETSRGLPNVLIVNAANADGKISTTANVGAKTIDVAVSVAGIFDDDAGQAALGLQPSSAIAAARLAALAARLRAVEPGKSATELKSRMIGLAAPLQDAPTRSGWIAEPRRHFWLE